MSPPGQTQLAFSQLAPVEHVFPHAPQLAGSACSLTHAPPHPVSAAGQQTPFDTMLPLGQTHAAVWPLWLHEGVATGQATAAPHFPAEVHVSTALPEQRLVPGVQTTHAPSKHTGKPPEHGIPTSAHVPDAVHSWGWSPLQLNAPTEQPPLVTSDFDPSLTVASCAPAS